MGGQASVRALRRWAAEVQQYVQDVVGRDRASEELGDEADFLELEARVRGQGISELVSDHQVKTLVYAGAPPKVLPEVAEADEDGPRHALKLPIRPREDAKSPAWVAPGPDLGTSLNCRPTRGGGMRGKTGAEDLLSDRE